LTPKSRYCILLSTFNGEIHLKPLLDSITTFADVDILIRDDGSTDNTVTILNFYASKFSNIYVLSEGGLNIGTEKSYRYLVKIALEKNYEWLAFCDQDDIWIQDRFTMVRGVNGIKPILYYGKALAFKEVGEVKKRFKAIQFAHSKSSKYASIFANEIPGCLMLFNKSLAQVFDSLDFKFDPPLHDEQVFAIANLFGEIHQDNGVWLYYRIHEYNQIGLPNKLSRISKHLLSSRKKIDLNISATKLISSLLKYTIQKNQEHHFLQDCGRLKEMNFLERCSFISKYKLHRSNLSKSLALYIRIFNF
jgi:glycosyltransferase involved in cell wall biosynthesis